MTEGRPSVSVNGKKDKSMPSFANAREAEAFRKAKMELQSLQSQSHMKRQKASDTIKDLMLYTNNNLKNDRLIYPDKINPFKPKKMCTIL